MPVEPRVLECPKCGGPLKECPRRSNWLNDDQYASVKAGDYFCETCPDNDRGKSGLCYWWEHELPQPADWVI